MQRGFFFWHFGNSQRTEKCGSLYVNVSWICLRHQVCYTGFSLCYSEVWDVTFVYPALIYSPAILWCLYVLSALRQQYLTIFVEGRTWFRVKPVIIQHVQNISLTALWQTHKTVWRSICKKTTHLIEQFTVYCVFPYILYQRKFQQEDNNVVAA